MANNVVLPTLTASGWLTDSNKILERLFLYFIGTAYSQSYIYHGSVSSLPWLYYRYGNDLEELATQVKLTLETYLSSYFDTAEVDVYTLENKERPGTYELHMSALVVDSDGNSHQLSKAVDLNDSIVKTMITYNNEGYPGP